MISRLSKAITTPLMVVIVLFLAGLPSSALGALPLPEAAVPRALVSDVVKLVESRDQIGWFIDALDVEKVLPDALDSVCRVSPQDLLEAMTWLEAQIAAGGGDVAKAYEAAGEELDAIDELLLWHRTLRVLQEAQRWQQRGECPFWLKTEADFRGRQSYQGRWVVSLESGGRVYGQYADQDFAAGAGGGGRILLGWGVNENLSLHVGPGLGGATRFDRFAAGERLDVPDVVVVGTAPFIARYHSLRAHGEFELGPLVYYNQTLGGRPRTGLRTGFGIGLSRTRVAGILPGLTLGLTYDFLPQRAGMPAIHQLGLGIRAVGALPLE